MLKVRPAILLLVAPLSGCALAPGMPPFSATRAAAIPVTATPIDTALLPAHRVFNHNQHIGREHDEATNQTRVSVTTHRGAYFLWVQRPRLTFFYVYSGAAVSQPPQSIFLVLRTVNPQVLVNNRLTLMCDGTRHELTTTPRFWLEHGPIATSRHYMYELGLETFVQLLACTGAVLSVGGVEAYFESEQLEALRDFAAGMR